jgi:hypothetical protein
MYFRSGFFSGTIVHDKKFSSWTTASEGESRCVAAGRRTPQSPPASISRALDCVNNASLSGFLVGKRDVCFVAMREGTVCDAVRVR